MIVGLSGNIGSGKDYLASNNFLPELEKKYGKVLMLAFGDFLKLEYGTQNNISYDKLYINKDTKTRQGLQSTGDYYRKKYGKDYYVRAVDLYMQINRERNNTKCFLITDVRYPVEYNYIREKKGIIYKIIAPERTLHKLEKETNGDREKIKEIINHSSETALDSYTFDGIIKNDFWDIAEDDIRKLLK